ncbi:uncharacterized protein [Palaemon carinicauda]|uniref:uncharacterized protein n=1 Tax=Palaemon carinicauda TaxID=392227 RepID=UPI0035B618A8
MPGLPRRDPNDPTGDRSTGPNPIQTSLIYSKTVSRNETVNSFTNITDKISSQAQHTLDNTLQRKHLHLNETSSKLHINNSKVAIPQPQLTHHNLSEIFVDFPHKMYENSSYSNHTTVNPYKIKQKRSESYADHHTSESQLVSGSSFSHISYLPSYQHEKNNLTGEMMPNVQLTFNINVPLQRYLNSLLNHETSLSGYSIAPQTALPFSESPSVGDSLSVTTTIKPIHVTNTNFGFNHAVGTPPKSSLAKPNLDSLNLSNPTKKLVNVHVPQTTLKPSSYTDSSRADIAGVPAVNNPLLFKHHKHRHATHPTNRQQRHRMLLNNYYRQRFRPFLHRRPVDKPSLFHGPVVRTRYLPPQRYKPFSGSFQNINFGHTSTAGPKLSIDTLFTDEILTPNIPAFHPSSTTRAPISNNGQDSFQYQTDNERDVYPHKPIIPSTIVTTNKLNPFHHNVETDDTYNYNNPPPIRNIHYRPTSSPHYRGNSDNPHLNKSIQKSNWQLSSNLKEKQNQYVYSDHEYLNEHYDSDLPSLNYPTTKYPHGNSDNHRKVNSHLTYQGETYHSTTVKPNYSTTKRPDVHPQMNNIFKQSQGIYHPPRASIEFTTESLPHNLLTTSSPETYSGKPYTSAIPHNPQHLITNQPYDKDHITTYRPPHRFVFTSKPSISLHTTENVPTFKPHFNYPRPHTTPSVTSATLAPDTLSVTRYQKVISDIRHESSTPATHPRYSGSDNEQNNQLLTSQINYGNIPKNLDYPMNYAIAPNVPSQYQLEPQVPELYQSKRYPSTQTSLHYSHDTTRSALDQIPYKDPHQIHPPLHLAEPLNIHQGHTQPPFQHPEISGSFVHFTTPAPIGTFAPASDAKSVNEPHHKITFHSSEEYHDSPPHLYFSDILNHYNTPSIPLATPLHDAKATAEKLGELSIPITQNNNPFLHDIPSMSNPSVVAVTPRANYGIQSPERIHTPPPSYPAHQPPSTHISITSEHGIEVRPHATDSPYIPDNRNIITLTQTPNFLIHTPVPNFFGHLSTPSYISSPTEMNIHHVHLSGNSTHAHIHDGSNYTAFTNGILSQYSNDTYDDHLQHRLEISENPNVIKELNSNTKPTDESVVLEPTFTVSQQNRTLSSQRNSALTPNSLTSLRVININGRRRVIKRRRSTTLSPLQLNNGERIGATSVPRIEKEPYGAIPGLESTPSYYKEEEQETSNPPLQQERRTGGQMPIGVGTLANSEGSKRNLALLHPFQLMRQKILFAKQSLAPRSVASSNIEDLPDSYLQSLVDVGFGKKISTQKR